MRTRSLASRSWLTAASALLVGATLLALAPSAQAQWKWRDDKGQVHVSDLPPPRGVPERNILQRPGAPARVAPQVVAMPPADAPASAAPARAVVAQPAAETELDKRRKAAERTAEAEQQAKSKAEEERLAAQRRENCGRARGHLAALESGQRIARMNDKGEREILDDKGRAEELRRAREVIASECR